MEIPRMYQYDHNTAEYLYAREAQVRPNGDPIFDALGATPIAPPSDIPAKHAARWTGKAWEIVEDHRQKQDAQGRIIEGTGTPYWLPGNTWQSQGQYTKDLGPLPDGAVLQKPEKSLNVAQSEKMREIATAHERALSGAVALNDPAPSTVAVESSLLAVSDPEGLEWIRDQLATRRAELEAQVQAAQTVADVEGIAVSYLV